MRNFFTKFAFVLALTSMLMVSCKKDDLTSNAVAASQQQIEVKAYAGSEGTQADSKAPIYGTSMPIDRNLKISAVYSPESDRGVEDASTSTITSKNYFRGITFSYNASKKTWSSEDEPVYWPLTGNLDFLAFSSEQQDLNATWGSADNELVTSSLTLNGFKAADFNSDDLLYGISEKASPSNTAVPIVFRHAKALIVFTAKASFDDAIKITSITLHGIKNPSADQTLTLTNNGVGSDPELDWELPDVGSDLSIPGIDEGGYVVPRTQIDVTKKSGYLGIGGAGVLLAEQTITSFTVEFTQQVEKEGIAGDKIEEKFTYDCTVGMGENPKWEAGKRYIYELDFRVNEIDVAATVDDWDDFSDYHYVIDLPEVARLKTLSTEDAGELKITLNAGTKLVVECGQNENDKEYFIYHNNYTREPSPSGQEKTDEFDFTVPANKYVRFYVSEDGKATVKGFSGNYEGDIFDTQKFVFTNQVTFDTGDGDTPVPPQDIEFKGKITKPADPMKEGFTFDGWYKDEECTPDNEWDFDEDKVTGPTTLYAKWEESTNPEP